DISKSHLDAIDLEGNEARQFENSAQGVRALQKWLDTMDVTRIVYEATGPYHRRLETALSGKFPLVKVNPLQARRFAQAVGTHAKTDAVDARCLARMGPLWAWNPTSPFRKICASSVTCRRHEPR
ncbi:IS110 family transposase, partial [Brevirhabdus sp.]|uniref:IS110 family transposase n=1 Tax=Brevirhabdus sp. TaxID=2004514 RepID=UPI0040591BC3